MTVHVPPGTPAGDYRGTITVKPADAAPSTVRVKLHVWDFELPREGHLKTHTWDEVEPLARFYDLDAYPVEWYLRLCDLLLKNRLNPGFAGVNYEPREPEPDGSYDFRATERVLRHCLDRGLTRFSVLQMRKGRYTADEAARTYAFVGAYSDFLRKKGWLDRALVALWDEPLLHEWPDVKVRAEKIRDVAPGLKVQLFANLSEGPYAFWTEESRRLGADRLIDIWAPIPPIEAPALQARGGEIWTSSQLHVQRGRLRALVGGQLRAERPRPAGRSPRSGRTSPGTPARSQYLLVKYPRDRGGHRAAAGGGRGTRSLTPAPVLISCAPLTVHEGAVPAPGAEEERWQRGSRRGVGVFWGGQWR